MKKSPPYGPAVAPALFFSLLALSPALHAQNPTGKAPVASALPANAPTLEVMPRVIGADGQVTVMLAPGANLPSPRQRVGLFEAGRAARVAEVTRDFNLVNGRWHATVNVQADPGNYEFRLLSAGRAPVPISADAPGDSFLVPGIEHGPGFWLFNGVPWALSDVAATPGNATLPLFLPGLQRTLGKKAKAPQNETAFASSPLGWRTISLPPLREMLAPSYDWTALRTEVTRRVGAAQTSNERGFAGFSLPIGEGDVSLSGAVNAITQLRTATNAAAPSAALILEVDATRNAAGAARDLDSVASLCDAVLLRVPEDSRALWAVKTARRIAEEQPFYDLPIWISPSEKSLTRPAVLLDYWMAGATGFVFTSAQWQAPGMEALTSTITRESSLWTGAVTLEDAGLVPPLDRSDALDDEALLTLYERLRGIGRVPLLARATVPVSFRTGPESFLLRLGDRISGATIDRLEKLVRDGATLYLEGVPLLDETGQSVPWRMATLTGAQITAMPPKKTEIVLEDPWVFGTKRGGRVPVEQTVSITLNPPSMSGQAKNVKGTFTPVGPRAAAKLPDGTPGLVINSLGKGEVVWLPHRLQIGVPLSYLPVGATPSGSAPTNTLPSSSAPRVGVTASATLAPGTLAPWQDFYNGTADYIASRLVQMRAANAQDAGPEAVRVALRRSPKGTMLVAFFNTTNRTASISATVEGASNMALDLTNGNSLTTTTRGLRTTVEVSLPANSWKIIAMASTQQELYLERNTSRSRAKLR